MSASDKPLAPCMVCQPIWIELGLPPEAALRWADTERDGCATLTWWDILISWHDLILSSVNTSGLPRSLRGAEFTSTCPGTRQSPRPIWEILVNCHVRHKKFQLPDMSLVIDLKGRFLSYLSLKSLHLYTFSIVLVFRKEAKLTSPLPYVPIWTASYLFHVPQTARILDLKLLKLAGTECVASD